MSTVPMVPVFSPDGQLGDIPHDRLMHAVKAGAVPGVHITDPQGNPGVVPANRMADAVKAGARIEPLTDQPIQHEGFWTSLLGDLGSAIKSMPSMFQAPITSLEGLRSGQERAASGAERIASSDVASKAAGHGIPYRIASQAVQAVGTNVPAMEESARQGDVGGVLGHATSGATLASAPLAVEGALRGANRVIPSTTRAGAGLNSIIQAHAEHPIATTAKDAAINSIVKDYAKLKTNVDPVTGAGLPEEIQSYIQAREAHSAVSGDLNQKQLLLENNVPDPMTFGDAATRLKLINKVIRKAGGFEGQGLDALRIESLKRFAQAADQDVRGSIASNPALAQDYANMISEYGAGKKIIRVGEKAGPVIGGGIGAYLGRNAGALAATEATGLGAVAGRYMGKPTIGAATRAIIGRQAGPPRLRSLPPSPEAYAREIIGAAPETKEALAAKYGIRNPGEADRRIARMGGKVKVRPIPQPTE